MSKTSCIVLAAGKGKRMKSDVVKVMHAVCGRPMIYYPVKRALDLRAERTVVVIGRQGDSVREYLESEFGADRVDFALQKQQRGTAHAVSCARGALRGFGGEVLILCGDVPLIRRRTLSSMISAHRRSGCALSVMTAVLEDPAGYGRIVRDPDGGVLKIVEHRDANARVREICEINTGIYVVDSKLLQKSIAGVNDKNRQGEFYLTDIVEIARKAGKRVRAHRAPDALEVMGINDRMDLAEAEAAMRWEVLEKLARSGVTFEDPNTTYVDDSVRIGRDARIGPGCVLRGTTSIGSRCRIEIGVVIEDSKIERDVHVKPYSVVEKSRVLPGAVIGPFARLRPQAHIGGDARIGNFVEIKKSSIGRGSKVSHLTYIGDSLIGSDVNIGAGTITCNYDGESKYTTVIEDGAFIGSDSQFIAPVTIGKGAYVGSGSTITKDVPPGSLAVARGRQINREGWAARLKRIKSKAKKS